MDRTTPRFPVVSLAVLLLIVPTRTAAQTTYTVPGTHATIQAALEAAVDGDTVLVGPGTYHEGLDLLGKSLTLESTDGAGATVVQAGFGATIPLRNSVSPGGTPLVRGFTFTGGTASGVRIDFGAPTFEQCIVTGNTTTAWGGGMYLTSSASAVLRECTITGNSGHFGGGGIRGQDLTLEDCVISGNEVPVGNGGGIDANASTLVGCTVSDNLAALGGGISGSCVLVDCVVSGNTASYGGGASSGLTSATGCLFEDNHAFNDGGASSARADRFSQCVFMANTAGNRGGALAWSQAYGAEFTPLRDLVFIDNHANEGGGAVSVEWLGGWWLDAAHGVIERCVFSNNSSPGDANDVAVGFSFASLLGETPVVEVTRCTFVGNPLFADGFDVVVDSSILFGMAEPIVTDGTWPLTVQYSAVQGGWPGVGNTGTNPLFVNQPDDDLRLSPGSVCINTGNPALPLDADGSRADMGALPYEPWADLPGTSLAGSTAPLASANGPLEPGSTTFLGVTGATPLATAYLVIGASELSAPFKLGVLVPNPDLVVPVPLPGTGALGLSFAWPGGIPPGVGIWVQWWIPDAGAPVALAATQGIVGTTP